MHVHVQARPTPRRLTRLNTTATGAPVFCACSTAYSSAQLSFMRWSRDILGRRDEAARESEPLDPYIM